MNAVTTTDDLTDEQRELARTAAGLFADAARSDPRPPRFDALPLRLDRGLWASLAKLGLLAPGVPEAFGGTGATPADGCVLAEQAGAALPAVPFVPAVAVAELLAAAGAGDVLSALVVGERVVVPAWETFPAAVTPRRRADLRLTGGDLVGTLRTVPFGNDADTVLAFTADATPVLFDVAGARVTPVDSFDLTEPLAEIHLDAHPARVLSLPELPVAPILLALAAELVGTAQRALDGAVAYAGQRHQFGRPIGSFQAIKHLLADRHVQLDAARLLVRTATADLTEPAARTALVAASDAADAATADALQVHGGIGFTWEHLSHVLLKRARARRSLLGSPSVQLNALAAHLLDRPRRNAASG